MKEILFMWHGYGWGWIPGLLFLIVVVVFIIWPGRKSKHAGDAKALDILRERYARGEIDKKEFEERKQDLLI